ncbi:hypothetical protein COBT_001550 [Conglomerata obtusa]
MWLVYFYFIYHCVVCDERVFEQKGVEQRINSFLGIFKEDFHEDIRSDPKDIKIFLETINNRINEYIKFVCTETPIEIYNYMVEKTGKKDTQQGNDSSGPTTNQNVNIIMNDKSLMKKAFNKYDDMIICLKSYVFYNYLTLTTKIPTLKNSFNIFFLNDMFVDSSFNYTSFFDIFVKAVNIACDKSYQKCVLNVFLIMRLKKRLFHMLLL